MKERDEVVMGGGGGITEAYDVIITRLSIILASGNGYFGYHHGRIGDRTDYVRRIVKVETKFLSFCCLRD